MKRISVPTSLAVLVTLAGCFPVSSYHSARTLAEGETAVGMTFSSTTYTIVDDETGEEERLTLPGIIPEFSYHIGITDDFEFGGRVAPGFLFGEIDAKWRFWRQDGLHMAVAPAVGQMAIVLNVTSVRAPLLVAYELHPRFALTAGANLTMLFVNDQASSLDDPFTEDEFITMTGFSFGLEVLSRNGFFRPSVEFSTAVIGGEDAMADNPLQIGAVVLHFGLVTGRELERLERIEQKLDGASAMLSWRHRFKPSAPN